jgi:hypothetical protein
MMKAFSHHSQVISQAIRHNRMRGARFRVLDEDNRLLGDSNACQQTILGDNSKRCDQIDMVFKKPPGNAPFLETIQLSLEIQVAVRSSDTGQEDGIPLDNSSPIGHLAIG